MTETRVVEKKPPKRQGIWSWVFDTSIGNAFRFLWWSVMVVFTSILVEWIGMAFFWEYDHSKQLLLLEVSYLGNFSRNLITGLYPKDIGIYFIGLAGDFVNYLHLPQFSLALTDNFNNAIATGVHYGVEAVINIVFVFAVRSAICLSAITGFLFVGVVAFVDGLVERDIRRACGGIESSKRYHVSKRFIKPILFLSFGGYLTMPVSIHPTLVFLPVMAAFGISIFTAAKTFQKFV